MTKKEVQKLEKHKILYLAVLQPNSVEYQRDKIMSDYKILMEEKSKIFRNPIYKYKERSLKLLTRLSVSQIQNYPSDIIIEILPRINKKIQYLQEAYKFIKTEKKYWPNVYPEIILMDFLFKSHNNIPLNEAILILTLLIDLQEDFRSLFKREFLKYLLIHDVEKKILRLEPEPPEYPITIIRSPVTWKCKKQIAKNRLEEILMTTHPVLQAINLLWQDLYSNSINVKDLLLIFF